MMWPPSHDCVGRWIWGDPAEDDTAQGQGAADRDLSAGLPLGPLSLRGHVDVSCCNRPCGSLWLYRLMCPTGLEPPLGEKISTWYTWPGPGPREGRRAGAGSCAPCAPRFWHCPSQGTESAAAERRESAGQQRREGVTAGRREISERSRAAEAQKRTTTEPWSRS